MIWSAPASERKMGIYPTAKRHTEAVQWSELREMHMQPSIHTHLELMTEDQRDEVYDMG